MLVLMPSADVMSQVRTRLDTEATLTEAEVRSREAKFFQSSAAFAEPAPCGTGVGSLIDKLEELQWQMYSGSCIPFVQREMHTVAYKCSLCQCGHSHLFGQTLGQGYQ